jgi:hypothetical protein
MSTTTIRTSADATSVLGQRSIKTVADDLLQAMTRAGLDDPRWESAGPLVSAAAQRLREALGMAIRGKCVSVPAVVREADFALAARPLLAAASVVDPAAAREFVQLADEATLALS